MMQYVGNSLESKVTNGSFIPHNGTIVKVMPLLCCVSLFIVYVVFSIAGCSAQLVIAAGRALMAIILVVISGLVD